MPSRFCIATFSEAIKNSLTLRQKKIPAPLQKKWRFRQQAFVDLLEEPHGALRQNAFRFSLELPANTAGTNTGGATGNVLPLEDDDVLHTQFGEVKCNRAPDNAAPDDGYVRCLHFTPKEVYRKWQPWDRALADEDRSRTARTIRRHRS